MQQLMFEAGTIQLSRLANFEGDNTGDFRINAARAPAFLEYVTLGSDTGFQAHDDRFTQRIDLQAVT